MPLAPLGDHHANQRRWHAVGRGHFLRLVHPQVARLAILRRVGLIVDELISDCYYRLLRGRTDR